MKPWSKWLPLLVGAAMVVAIWLLLKPTCLCEDDPGEGGMDAARTQAKRLSSALESYKADHGHYPSESEGLAALLPANQKSRAGYVDGSAIDPWGNPFVYRLKSSPSSPNNKFQIYSKGPNGIDEGGGGDDVGIDDHH